MPLTPINYENGFIYKIVCNDINVTEWYVGSTTNLIKRRQQHKKICNNPATKNNNWYVYKFIRENGGWESWSIVLVENFGCKEKLEL